jgi:hypothetical protein
MDPNDILPMGADTAAIGAAFRKAAKACHPDLHPNDPTAARRFRRLMAARERLRRHAGSVHRRSGMPARLADPHPRRRIYVYLAGAGVTSMLLIAAVLARSTTKPSVPPPEVAAPAIEEALIPDADSAEVKAMRDLRESSGTASFSGSAAREGHGAASKRGTPPPKQWLRNRPARHRRWFPFMPV